MCARPHRNDQEPSLRRTTQAQHAP
jgi:hypothetical protein